MKHFFSDRFPVLIYLIIGSLWSIVTACNNDPEPQVLQLVTGPNYVGGNRQLAGGKSLLTAVYARAASADAPLSKLRITFGYDSTNITQTDFVFLDSTLAANTTEFALPVNYAARNLGGKEHWQFIAEDSKGKEYSQQIKFATTSANNDKSAFYTFNNVVLSRPKSKETGRESVGLVAFSSADGTGYPAYVLHQPAISTRYDFVLNGTNTAKPSLTANARANTLYLTKLTSVNFDAVNTVAAIKGAYPTAGSLPQLDSLKVNQVIAYKTAANKVGLLRIKTVYKTRDSLAFDVKAEK